MSTTSLPAGATCGTCHLFSVCRSRFNRLPVDTECEHAPNLYRPAAPPLNSQAKAVVPQARAWDPKNNQRVAKIRRRRIREAIRDKAPFPRECGPQFLLFESGGAA